MVVHCMLFGLTIMYSTNLPSVDISINSFENIDNIDKNVFYVHFAYFCFQGEENSEEWVYHNLQQRLTGSRFGICSVF